MEHSGALPSPLATDQTRVPENCMCTYYLLKNPQKTKNNNPYIALIRKNMFFNFLGGVLQQLVGTGGL